MKKALVVVFKRCIAGALFIAFLSSLEYAQDWEQPPRSQMNLDALERVKVRSYQFKEAGDIKMEYGVYVPTGYDSTKTTPLVIALHGLGSGIRYMMEYNNLVELAEQYGYLVATPMGFNPYGWYGALGQGNEFMQFFHEMRPDVPNDSPANLGELSEKDVMNVLKDMLDHFNVDRERIYLIGQSMGGAGTWHLGSKYPDIWAALAPLAPGVYRQFNRPATLIDALQAPVILVVGDKDSNSLFVVAARRCAAKMKELGMDYEYIEVPGGTHSSAGRENIDKVFEFLSRHKKQAN